MTLTDRDRRVFNEIARQTRVDDPDFAVAFTGPTHRPRPVWTPIWLRALAFLLLAIGVLASVTLLVLAAFAVFGIAQLFWLPSPPRPARSGEDRPERLHGS